MRRRRIMDYRFGDLLASALGYGMALAILVFLAAVFHFAPWHFFEDISGRSGDGPSTVVDFTILATILAFPGLWLTVQGWMGVTDDGSAASGCLLGFGFVLLTDAATATSWSMGHPVTRYQAFGAAYVLMAFAITRAYCRRLPSSPRPRAPEAPGRDDAARTMEGAQAARPTLPPPTPSHGPRPRPGPPRCRIRPPRYCSDHDE